MDAVTCTAHVTEEKYNLLEEYPAKAGYLKAEYLKKPKIWGLKVHLIIFETFPSCHDYFNSFKSRQFFHFTLDSTYDESNLQNGAKFADDPVWFFQVDATLNSGNLLIILDDHRLSSTWCPAAGKLIHLELTDADQPEQVPAASRRWWSLCVDSPGR